MRRFIGIICIIVLIFTGCANEERNIDSVYKGEVNDQVNDGIKGFSFDLFKEINEAYANENVCISPYSINAALGMTYNGSGGDTKIVFSQVFDIEGVDDITFNQGHKYLYQHLNSLTGVELDTFNAIWIDKSVEIKDDFKNTNIEVFDAYVEDIDFSKKSSPSKMNKWISDRTNGLISDMISDPIQDDTMMILANTVNFKGQWVHDFEERLNRDEMFTNGDGTESQAVLMSQKVNLFYSSQEDYRLVRLPYEENEAAMYCVLPEGDSSLNDLIESLNEENWAEMKFSANITDDVILRIPKFEIETDIPQLKDVLTKLGLGIAFDSDKADFSNIVDGLYLSSVKHRAIIKVDETGTEAVAATVEETKGEERVEVRPEFIANRPFLFIIEDTETKTILFIGKVENME